jgi:TolB protein
MLILNQKDKYMYKVLLLLSLVLSSVFAQVDANLEVVKKTNALPKMLVSVATDSPEEVSKQN